MALRFFADHCVPRSIIKALQSKGHEILLLRDHLPTDAPDPVVIEKARELDTILISLDGDFADIVGYPPARYSGIIALQVRNHPEVVEQIVARLTDYLADYPNVDHYRGKLLLVEAHRIRIRT